MLETIKNKWQAQAAVIFFLTLSSVWIFVYPMGSQSSFNNYVIAALYGLLALWGGICGLFISQKWGGLKSVMGKAVFFLALGLFAEEFGQIVFSYYNIFSKIIVPYPSLADIGFFANIPFYIIGISFIAKASGAQFSLRKFKGKFLAALLPLIVLIISYLFFLQKYQFDWSNPVKIFLDFGYPLGQATYISIAIVTYLLSRKYLGGMMKSKILFIIGAFVFQYVADYNFLFQSSRGTWVNGAYGDYLYFFAYLVMTLGILQFGHVVDKLRK